MGVTSYLTVEGEILSETRSGVEADFIPDPLGSTAALLNSSQTITDTFTWWPYGEQRSHPTGSSITPFGYIGTSGYYADVQSERLYVEAREFRPKLTRWQTVDPLWPIQSAYVYVDSAPTTSIDPSGLQTETAVLGGSGGLIAGGGAGAGEFGACLGLGGLIGAGIGLTVGGTILIARSVPRRPPNLTLRRARARIRYRKTPNYRNCASLYRGCQIAASFRPPTWYLSAWLTYCDACRDKCVRYGLAASIASGCNFWDIILQQSPTTTNAPIDISILLTPTKNAQK